MGIVDEELVGGQSQFVLRVRADLPREFDDLLVDLLAEECVDELRRPRRRVTGDDAVDGVLTAQRPLVRAFGEHVDQRELPVLLDQLVEHPSDGRPPLRIGEPAHDGVVDHLRDVLVVEHADNSVQQRRRFGGDAFGIARFGQPRAQAQRNLRRLHLLRHHVGREEVVAHERSEARPELILLLSDDRGVRNRNAQGVLEQSCHREPVRESTDHPGLRGRAHVTDPLACALRLLPTAEEIDSRCECEEPCRDEFHLAEIAPLGGVVEIHQLHTAIVPAPASPSTARRAARERGCGRLS